MATFESNTKNSLHFRSNSWPSATHPLLSVNQEGIARECCEKWVDELLDRSLRLLDISTTAKDCLLQSKESMLELHSIIRRRRSADTGFVMKAGKYLASRKNMKKEIRKALRNFEGMTNEFSANRENDILSILKVTEAVTVSTLGSLLSFISDPKGQLKQNGWSAISKLILPKRVACSEESESNEFEMVDAALKSLTSHKLASTENFQVYMGNLEMCIDDLEAGVGILSRKLIKTRVSLNIFNR
ncbi:hypothetical protein K1719_000790 [Acacia pycnantha]|nr:hypothetical protein K1719_000790 [Acacia pycnantha]